MKSVHKENIVLKLLCEVEPADARTINGQSKICNWLYNHLLQKALELKRQFCETQNQDTAKTLYTKRGLRNLLPKIKEEHPFLKVVHSSPLKNAALRLSSAIQAHQKSKKGKRKGKQIVQDLGSGLNFHKKGLKKLIQNICSEKID